MNGIKIMRGIQKAYEDQEAEKYAREYLIENGYKLTTIGKNRAMFDLDVNDNYGYEDEEFVSYLKTAIALVKVD